MALVNTKFYQRSTPSPTVNGNVLASRTHAPQDADFPYQLSVRLDVFTRLRDTPRLRVKLSQYEAEDLFKSLAFLLGKMAPLVLVFALALTAHAQTPTASRATAQDPARFTKAKLAIATRVLKQEQARADTCNSQPTSKRDMCETWAKAGNEAATDIQSAAFAEIDKLAKAEEVGK